jgi:hypothetical protein
MMGLKYALPAPFEFQYFEKTPYETTPGLPSLQ